MYDSNHGPLDMQANVLSLDQRAPIYDIMKYMHNALENDVAKYHHISTDVFFQDVLRLRKSIT